MYGPHTTNPSNPVLKVGCVLMIVGGAASAVCNILGLLISLNTLAMLNGGRFGYLERQMREATDGLLGAEEAVDIILGLMVLVIAVIAAMLIIDLAVGFVGLGRARQPEKYRFFLVWGIVLLVIGSLGTLFSGVLTMSGLTSLVCGVAAPILFLVGASQQKRALLASQSQAVRW